MHNDGLLTDACVILCCCWKFEPDFSIDDANLRYSALIRINQIEIVDEFEITWL